jgi:hypothetical protein
MIRNTQTKTLFRVGLVAFLVSAGLQIPARVYPDFHPDLLDGLRGLCLGIFIGAMAVTTWRKGRPSGSRSTRA